MAINSLKMFKINFPYKKYFCIENIMYGWQDVGFIGKLIRFQRSANILYNNRACIWQVSRLWQWTFPSNPRFNEQVEKIAENIGKTYCQ